LVSDNFFRLNLVETLAARYDEVNLTEICISDLELAGVRISNSVKMWSHTCVDPLGLAANMVIRPQLERLLDAVKVASTAVGHVAVE